MAFWTHLLTGSDNQTVAIGRVLGLIVALLFVIILPSFAVVSVVMKWMVASDWQLILQELTTYEPAVALSVAGLIGLTAFSEPKGS